MNEFVVFKVGGEEVKAGPLTLQRLKKLWPAVNKMSEGGSMVDVTTPMAQIVAVATETDPDRLDNVSVEDLGTTIERKFLVTEIGENQKAFSALMQMSGMGAKPGNAEPATSNNSTEIGTQ